MNDALADALAALVVAAVRAEGLIPPCACPDPYGHRRDTNCPQQLVDELMAQLGWAVGAPDRDHKDDAAARCFELVRQIRGT